jgi:hypothetical protein
MNLDYIKNKRGLSLLSIVLDKGERSELQGQFILNIVSERICNRILETTGKKCDTKMIHQLKHGTYMCPNCFNYDNSEYHQYYEHLYVR